jgi:ATP-dependent DNA helicase Q5
VCKDPKEAAKGLENFQRLAVNNKLKTVVGYDNYDPSDFYEGGRQGQQTETDYYQDVSDDTDNESRSEQTKKQDKDFIQKQFALRKAQAAK